MATDNTQPLGGPPDCYAGSEPGTVVVNMGGTKYTLPVEAVGDFMQELGWAAVEAKMGLPACDAPGP